MKEIEKPRWLDEKSNVAKVYWSIWIACGLLLAVEPLVHKHGEFAFEEWFGFHGLLGVVAGVLLVAGAKALRALVKRPEDYYERR